jgi:hypothetical protein
MKISTDRILFENHIDVINYVTQGLAPSKKEFQKLKETISDGTSQPLALNKNIFNTNITMEELELIYNNKRRNELVAFILGGVAFIVALAYGIRWGANSARRESNNATLGSIDISNAGDLMKELNEAGNIRIIRF